MKNIYAGKTLAKSKSNLFKLRLGVIPPGLNASPG